MPGPGWVDFDPSGGSVGNEPLIRVAVAHHPREAIPLQGACPDRGGLSGHESRGEGHCGYGGFDRALKDHVMSDFVF